MTRFTHKLSDKIKVSEITDNTVTDALLQGALVTPAFVYDLNRIQQQLELLSGLSRRTGCRPIYSIKSQPCEAILELVGETLHGVSVSSLYEARWARERLGASASLNLTTPGLRADEAGELAELCDCVSFNSLQQYQQLQPLMRANTSCGLRINPQLSLLDEQRYDPCRPFSKLGVPIDELLTSDHSLDAVEGLHFHTSFGGESFAPLRSTLQHVMDKLPTLFQQIKWLNLGGGYLFNTEQDLSGLDALVLDCQRRYGIEVFFEPGKAIVGEAGYLISSVLDVFVREGKSIAVLDTSVNHLPEVFEYQRPPTLYGDTQGAHRVLLAGSSCLSGDLMGEFGFERPLQPGDRIIFADVGAYSLVKASRFNGYGLPALYVLNTSGDLILQRHDSYADYRKLWLRE